MQENSTTNKVLVNELSDDPFVIFVHIHKCAGMTFQRELLRIFGRPFCVRAWKFFTAEKNVELVSSMESMTIKDRYFSGHLSFGIHQHLPSPATYISFLREPVSRMISLYNHSISDSGSYYNQLASNLSFTDFTLTGKGPLEADNGMTRFLAGGGSRLFIEDRRFGEVDEALFQKAVSHLEKYFSFVGLTEMYDLSHVTFYRLLGRQPQPYIILNQARGRHNNCSYTDVDIEQIRELNQYDIRLYEYGKRFLEKQAERLGITSDDVTRFAEMNKEYNRKWGPFQKKAEAFKEKVKSLKRS